MKNKLEIASELTGGFDIVITATPSLPTSIEIRGPAISTPLITWDSTQILEREEEEGGENEVTLIDQSLKIMINALNQVEAWFWFASIYSQLSEEYDYISGK